jgi:hypothetical protein
MFRWAEMAEVTAMKIITAMWGIITAMLGIITAMPGIITTMLGIITVMLGVGRRDQECCGRYKGGE